MDFDITTDIIGVSIPSVVSFYLETTGWTAAISDECGDRPTNQSI